MITRMLKRFCRIVPLINCVGSHPTEGQMRVKANEIKTKLAQFRKGGRVVYCTALEMRRTVKFRGFESHPFFGLGKI